MTNLVELAEGLSEGELTIVRDHSDWFGTMDRLYVKGLITEGPDLMPRLTPLGAQVRHLLSQGKEKGES